MARKAKKVMSQTFTLERCLTKINKEEIRSDQDVQRLSGQFNAAMINELWGNERKLKKLFPEAVWEPELTACTRQ